MDDEKATLLRYLQVYRDALLWKLDGLSEREARMPRTATGSNLLGIVKHVASVEADYLGSVFGRPWPEPMPWMADEAEANADMWAEADESMADVVDRYLRVQAHGDATVAALTLTSTGTVPWWGDDGVDVALHRILVHLVAEVARHAGHMDVLREQVDGAVGHRASSSNLPGRDAAWWSSYVERLRAVAEASPA